MLNCEALADNVPVPFENQPMFLGYKPLVMAVYGTEDTLRNLPTSKKVVFLFRNKKNDEVVASLDLRIDKVVPLENKLLIILTGISGKQNLETRFGHLAFRMRQRFGKKHTGVISLDQQEYEQLKIAYSVPREIKILNVFKGDAGNIFPIDLFGYAGDQHFLLSLRHEKKSSQQLEIADKIIAWSVRAGSAPSTYALGKNHSADFARPILPVNPLGNDEFQLEQIIGNYGIHRIYLLRITESIRGKDEEQEKLVHVHYSYANWMKRHGFPLKETTR